LLDKHIPYCNKSLGLSKGSDFSASHLSPPKLSTIEDNGPKHPMRDYNRRRLWSHSATPQVLVKPRRR